MVPFEFLVPYSIEEALSLLDAEDPGIRPVGGGTAVMLMMKAGVLRPTRLVSLHAVERRYTELHVNASGALVIGGLTRLSTIENDADVKRGWPMLARTMRTLSNVRVRSVATIGGGLAHADPHMDLPPVLSALGAIVSISGPHGTRSVPVADLCTGYYETVVARDELITAVTVPAQPSHTAYMKVTTRASHDWPALGLALAMDVRDNIISKASVFIGAATDRPTRLTAAQAVLDGATIEDATLLRAGEAGVQEVDLIGDQHGSAAYKRQLLKVMLGRAVRLAVQSRSAS
ncbi:molybdopterin dehydrogenase [Burkholderia cepacia]|uniref:Molybdopterin dehydrogenase n=2 Tax=Burkholderia cepacia complex TaxID=87882 RepID=A0A1B4PZB2_BURCE|nr:MULTISPECIES: xanthine dehydrogenase family protein subunit M [Burkholderia cepacia complex]AOK19261.1 molybdopterin dehydrogenase [Burkholderia cepacia]AOK26019.1 molybdopterin dehydrogenase [Burkholderia ubonensis]